MARTVTFDLLKQCPAEISAAFFALIIYPENEKMREQLLCGEMHRQLRHWAEIDPEGADLWQFWPTRWLLFDPQKAERLHAQAMAIFNEKRCVAAEIARAFLAEALGKGLFGRAGVRLTENGEPLGEMTWETLGLWGLRQERSLAGRDDDPDQVHWKTVQERSWARTKRVLHLVGAFLTMLHGDTEEKRQASWAEVFSDPQNTLELLKRAELWRVALLVVAATGRIRLTRDELIRVVAK